MYHKTKGIVLHTIKYSETSVITKIYTEKLGLVSYMVNGVRTIKSSAKASMLRPLTLLDMEVQHRENKNLQHIKEFKRSFTYQSIPFDTLKSTISLFLLEVITKSVHEHDPNEEMFEFIFEALVNLDEASKINPDFHLIFLVQLTRYLGFGPHDNYSEKENIFEMREGVFTSSLIENNTILDKKDSELLFRLIGANVFGIKDLGITRKERKLMLKNLLKYYQLHIEGFSLKSPEILEELLD